MEMCSGEGCRMNPGCARYKECRAAAGLGADPGTITICLLCRKRVYQVRNGEWYHDRNSSAFCHPGDGTGRKAVPLTISGKRD